MAEPLERDAKSIAAILHVYGGPHASAAFRRIVERLIAKDATDAEIVALVRAGVCDAPPDDGRCECQGGRFVNVGCPMCVEPFDRTEPDE